MKLKSRGDTSTLAIPLTYWGISGEIQVSQHVLHYSCPHSPEKKRCSMFLTWVVVSQVWALESGSFLILHRFHSTFIWKEIWFNQLSSVTRIPNYWQSMSSQASGDLKFRLKIYKFTIRNTIVSETVLKCWPVWSQVTVKMFSWETGIRAEEVVSDDTQQWQLVTTSDSLSPNRANLTNVRNTESLLTPAPGI